MRFEISRTEQEVFADLERLCSSPGYIHVLSILSFRDNLILFPGHLTSEAYAASYAPERTIRTEFSTLMGLMLKHPINFEQPSQDAMSHLMGKTGELLEELHACFNRPMIDGFQHAFDELKAGKSREEVNPFSRADVLREPIFYGGESAYNFQYSNFAVDRYALDDNWLLANKGFQIADGRAVAEALGSLPNDKIAKVVDATADADRSNTSFLAGFTFSSDEIAAAAGLSLQRAQAVLDAFTAPDAPTNTNFETVSDYNIANACPILRMPAGDYISLQSYGMVEALYDSPYYWMAADKSYRNEAFKHRGEFTEEFVTKRLAEAFGAAHVHRGVNIEGKAGRVSEIDVLILFADRALVIQCKSKKLTLEARKGNDLQLRDDFKKAIQDAYDQAILCGKALCDSAMRFMGPDGIEIQIPKLKEIYPLCIVSDHYPALATQTRQFLSFETDDVIQPPLIGDLFLIDVLVEMLATPLRLLSYVNRRVRLGEQLNSSNELTILAYHLRQNLWVEEGISLLTLSEDIAASLDIAMTVRRTGVPGERTPEGILTHLEGTVVGRIISHIERRPEPALVDLGFLLLSLGSDAIDELNIGIKRITDQTRWDRQPHDLTMALDGGSSGITIHCSYLHNAEAAAKLLDHCQRRKYVHRAASWFGLAVRVEDGLPKFGTNLRSAWKHNSTLERATRGMRRAALPSATTKAPMPKLGRNELCHCGSGKKFKKCCLK